MKKIKIGIIIIISSLSLTAQNSRTKTADKAFSQYNFLKAIKHYTKLVEKGKADAYVYTRLGDANYNIFNTTEAEKWYAKAVDSGSDISAETMYNYAQMLKANGKYEESNNWMKKFASKKPSDYRAIAFNKEPDYIPKILERGKKFNVQNLEINSPQSDFGGTLENGKLYITSARNSNRRTYKWNEQPFLDIYEFGINDDNTYQTGKLIEGKVNTKYHEGTVTFSPDGNTMYFSRESFYRDQYQEDTENNNEYSVLQIFKATKNGNSWTNVEPLPFNSNNYNVDHPSLSADGKTLYFTSDMPGGFGQGDIYKVAVNGNSYGTPENLGQKVNTEGREMFPYISNNGTLYLASDGHLGLGGLDIFYTKEIDGKLAPIHNIGIPINSNADDFAFRIDENTNEGFVSSNREGGQGSDDVYAIKKLQPLCDVQIISTVVDKKTGNPIPEATATLYDSKGNKLASKQTDNNGIAEFIVECDTETNLEVSMTDYDSTKVPIAATDEEEVTVAVALDPIEKIIEEKPKVIQIVLNPIYFEFDKSNITREGAFELDRLVNLMKKYPSMIVRATSHTDTRGSDAYNMQLSDRRAKTTVQYIISKGISEYRISGTGMGETQLKINCGTSCTKEQHALNRRSEFYITSGAPTTP